MKICHEKLEIQEEKDGGCIIFVLCNLPHEHDGKHQSWIWGTGGEMQVIYWD